MWVYFLLPLNFPKDFLKNNSTYIHNLTMMHNIWIGCPFLSYHRYHRFYSMQLAARGRH